MQRALVMAFIIALIAGAATILGTAEGMPDRVASHFNASNVANAWIDRAEYVALMLLFAVGLPVLVVLLLVTMPRVAPRLVNLPNRSRWLAPAERARTLSWLVCHACWLGLLLIGFGVAVHVLVMMANAQTPPLLPDKLLAGLVVAFIAGIGWWVAALIRRFGRPQAPAG